jgi:hypothetical protein
MIVVLFRSAMINSGRGFIIDPEGDDDDESFFKYDRIVIGRHNPIAASSLHPVRGVYTVSHRP